MLEEKRSFSNNQSVVLMLPEGLPPAIVVTILQLSLVWRYRDAFKGIVQPDPGYGYPKP
jgi:hypothetical protein